jgi:hypothetical protein
VIEFRIQLVPSANGVVGLEDAEVGSYSGRARVKERATPMNSSPPPAIRRNQDENARGVESLLWLAAGAAWAIVALKAWSQTKKVEARRRTFVVSDRLLKQVFPNGIRHH